MRYEDVLEHVERLVGEGDQLQRSVRRRSDELRGRGVVSIDPLRGRFLELVARLVSPQRILEIGSGVGYSALWFMRAVGSRGRLDAVEGNRDVAREFQKVMREAGLSRRVRVHVAPALSTLRKLRGPYDIVFIDADKDEYPQYLTHAIRLTRPGGVILADNMLWSGATFLNTVRKEGAESIVEYTRRIFEDDRLSSLIIPLGDGLAFSIRVR